MKVVFTPEGDRQATEKDRWWREHRPSYPDLFSDELSAALELIARTPNAGASYQTMSGKQMRRVLMPRTKNHVYFEVDQEHSRVIVHAVWGTPRGRGPDV
ncbi:MAG TPA: type II toxin-antitoxin system RelE/ParE family toxin [Anaeromyxobacteraceae bacterium]|nr:type II toxin-antitoxin system RelE/ParE family toxin [Anaeromyxobacteraceae bacterium]